MKTNKLEYIDFEEVNTLLEGFNRITGFVTAILDLEGNVLSKSGWRQICTEFHRINSETSRNCSLSDTVLANKLAKNENYHFYECLNGLVDVAVPIVINGEHIANLFSGQFFLKEPDRDYFKKQAARYGFNEQSYLKVLEDVPIVSMENVKIAMDFLLSMTKLISEITLQKFEQSQLNEALGKSEERFHSALDNMLEGCQIIGFDWRYIYLNRTAEIHNRRPNNELIGKRYKDMWPGIENTEVYKIIEQVLEKRVSNHFENEFLFPDGSLGWFDLSIQTVPEGVFILSIDITERKRAENAQRESEEKYRLISDNSDDWIYWKKPDGHMHYVSPACERVTGYSPEEFVIHPELNNEIIYKVDQEIVNQHVKLSVVDDTPHNLEFRIVTKGGEIRWISHSCSPLFSNNGEYLGRRSTNRNITERKRQDEQLFESEFRFSKLYENGPFGMVMANKEFRFLKANPAFCTIMGYSEAELQKLTFKDLSHTDDLVKDLHNVRKLMNKEISVYKTEKRYIRKDGEIIWGSLTVTATYDSDGHFLYNLSIIEDITRRKTAEEKIEQLNERISTATRASQVGIWDWDVKNDKLVWDDQMYALYGLKKEEFTGAYEAWIKGLHPDDIEFSRNETRLALLGEKEYDTEFRIILPDGTVRYCKAKGEVFRDETGDPVRMVGINYDITVQKMIEKKIREKDMEFRKLSANVPDMIYQFTRRPDGTYFVPIASEGIRNIFGCTPEEVLDDFTPISRVIYPDDAERVISNIEYSAEHMTYFTCEFRVQIPGREIQWIYSNSSPERLPDGSVTWYGFNVDITHKKMAEAAIQENNARLELAMQAANMAWWEMDIPTGNVTFNNRKATMLGYPPENFSHYTDFTALIHPEDFDTAMNAMKKHISGLSDKYEVEYRIKTSSGEYKWFYDIGAMVKRASKEMPLNIIGFVIDITDRKKAEDEIRKLNETLEQRVEDRTAQLKAANQEQEAFSYSVSHDLRSPLRHINGFAEILTKQYSDLLPEEANKLLNTITGSAKKMGTLIDDLLSFSRTGRAELKKSTLKMNQVIEDALLQINPSLKDRKIDWKISPLPVVQGDYNLLLMVWINLLDNAVKYTRTTEKAVIRIGYKNEKGETVFFIKDNGVGFDMKYAHRLFGVFQRLHSSSHFEGTGIGLANVRRIILRHGGRTWAEAKTDKGATFYFSIPK